MRVVSIFSSLGKKTNKPKKSNYSFNFKKELKTTTTFPPNFWQHALIHLSIRFGNNHISFTWLLIILFTRTNLFSSRLFLVALTLKIASHCNNKQHTPMHMHTHPHACMRTQHTRRRQHTQPWPWNSLSQHIADHLEIIDGEHDLREAGQLEEKEMAGFQQLARVAQSVIWRRGEERRQKFSCSISN